MEIENILRNTFLNASLTYHLIQLDYKQDGHYESI